MASTFFLQNLPRQRVLSDLSRRYPALQPSAVEAMLTLLRVSSDVLARIDAQMARRRISQGKFCVLMTLNVEPERALSPSELADRIGVSRATVTGLVDGLEGAGFLRRSRHERDRRSQSIRLTPKARRFLDRMLPGHYRRTARLMGGLRDGERRRLVALLGKIAERVHELEGR